MPLRRTRLPPPPLLAALLAGSILLSAVWPGKSSRIGCCAVKSVTRLTTSTGNQVWHFRISSNRSVIHDDLQIAIRTCCAAGYCSTTAVPCINTDRSVEDPSDALWLRSYNSGGEMVVLVRSGLLALVVLVAAILVDGALARPRRERVAYSPLAALVLLALSALLQLVLLPRQWQPSAAGAGYFQTMTWFVLVIVGAFLLPAAALALQSIAVAYVQVLILTIRTIFWCIIGCLGFALLAIRFYSRNFWLQLRVFYSRHDVHADVDYAQDVYMEQLNISYDFVSGISNNPLIRVVNETINNSAKLVLRTTLGAGNSAREFADLSDAFAGGDQGSVGNDDELDDLLEGHTDEIMRVPPGSTHPIPQRGSEGSGGGGSDTNMNRRVREDTPLLSIDSSRIEDVP